MHEKDPFGDKLRDKERAEEDLYFAKRDREALDKLRGGDDAAKEAALREVAHGRCPRDGQPLGRRSIDGVDVEQCASCQGIWLDKGELESLSRRESEGWLGRYFRQSVVQTR
jgi:hypothetical protein